MKYLNLLQLNYKRIFFLQNRIKLNLKLNWLGKKIFFDKNQNSVLLSHSKVIETVFFCNIFFTSSFKRRLKQNTFFSWARRLKR